MKTIFMAAFAACSLMAAPISVTLTDQVDSVMTFTLAGGQVCHDASQFSSSCSSQVGGASATAAASINAQSSLVSAAAQTVGGANRSTASTLISSTILIAGGTGTGYVNLAYNFASSGSTNNVLDISVNDAEIRKSNYSLAPIWTVLPFTFNDPLTYSVSLSAQADGGFYYGGAASLVLTGARVYSSQPQCDPGQFSGGSYGLCADPGYYDATAVFADPPASSAAEAPEPATVTFMALGLLVLGLTRLRYSSRPARRHGTIPCAR